MAAELLPSATNDTLATLLARCVEKRASDLHLAAGEPPFFRTDGILQRDPELDVMTESCMESLVRQMMNGRELSVLETQGSIDGAISSPDGGRYRFNIFRRQNQTAIAIRRLEDRLRSLEDLGLPTSLYELSELRDGLVVVAGPTGSGKSTTLATLIDRINETQQGHIITIEDPIEYLHPSRNCLVNQRQIGVDANNFYQALVSALRQDPDVILVGEIRELETIRTAITAAETGHLVFATVHAGDSVGVIERITSVFPAEEQSGVRRQLALVLRAVVSQHLMIADGSASIADARSGRDRLARRVVASEIMRVNSAVANLIATGKSAQIYSSLESGTSAGMQTLDQDLARLVYQGKISDQTASAYARNPNMVQERLARLRTSGGLRAASTRGESRRRTP